MALGHRAARFEVLIALGSLLELSRICSYAPALNWNRESLNIFHSYLLHRLFGARILTVCARMMHAMKDFLDVE
jgi:hypothetical protein